MSIPDGFLIGLAVGVGMELAQRITSYAIRRISIWWQLRKPPL